MPTPPGHRHYLFMFSAARHRIGRVIACGSILLSTWASIARADSSPRPAATPIELTIATFNLRYASDKSPNSWPERRPAMKACIDRMSADAIGTQEGLYSQLKDIAADQPDYGWIGTGRDGGSRGEFMAIFYRKSRLEPMEFDHFWLSDTPNVIASTNWGNTNRRMTTWVRFREHKTGREFIVLNTHLDHAVVSAREKGAALIRQRIEQLTNNLPVVLVGDFNADPAREKAYRTFVDDGFLSDAWLAADRRQNEGLDTFHDFKGVRKGTYRIDWILTRGPWHASEAEVFVFSLQNQYPSDHHPVLARLRLD